MAFEKITIPADGEKISVNADHTWTVPNHPIIPFIEDDAVGSRYCTQVLWQRQSRSRIFDPLCGNDVAPFWMDRICGANRQWNGAGDCRKTVSYALKRLIEGAERFSCSGFGDAVIDRCDVRGVNKEIKVQKSLPIGRLSRMRNFKPSQSERIEASEHAALSDLLRLQIAPAVPL